MAYVDLVAAISKETGVSVKTVEKVLKQLGREIQIDLLLKKKVTIPDLGNFTYYRFQKANANTGEIYEEIAIDAVNFTPDPTFHAVLKRAADREKSRRKSNNK